MLQLPSGRVHIAREAIQQSGAAHAPKKVCRQMFSIVRWDCCTWLMSYVYLLPTGLTSLYELVFCKQDLKSSNLLQKASCGIQDMWRCVLWSCKQLCGKAWPAASLRGARLFCRMSRQTAKCRVHSFPGQAKTAGPCRVLTCTASLHLLVYICCLPCCFSGRHCAMLPSHQHWVSG